MLECWLVLSPGNGSDEKQCLQKWDEFSTSRICVGILLLGISVLLDIILSCGVISVWQLLIYLHQLVPLAF